MLGCFQGLIRYRFARKLFDEHLARIREFLDEAAIAIALPDDPGAYADRADRLMQDLTLAAVQRSQELGTFVFIGASSVLDASMRAAGAVESDDLRDSIVEALRRYGLDGPRLYERFLVEVARERAKAAHGKVLIDHVLSPALRFLRDAIEALDVDAHTSFVAMPFKPPYSGYFGTLYRPLANAVDATALRMWGGLSGEDYVDLMLAVMRRCGTVIADLSELNPNVVFELGAARALDKRLALLCQRRFARALPANVRSEQLLMEYSPREPGWPASSVLRCAAQLSAIDLGRELERDETQRFRHGAGQALPTLPAAQADTRRGRRRRR